MKLNYENPEFPRLSPWHPGLVPMPTRMFSTISTSTSALAFLTRNCAWIWIPTRTSKPPPSRLKTARCALLVKARISGVPICAADLFQPEIPDRFLRAIGDHSFPLRHRERESPRVFPARCRATGSICHRFPQSGWCPAGISTRSMATANTGLVDGEVGAFEDLYERHPAPGDWLHMDSESRAGKCSSATICQWSPTGCSMPSSAACDERNL